MFQLFTPYSQEFTNQSKSEIFVVILSSPLELKIEYISDIFKQKTGELMKLCREQLEMILNY